MYFKPFDFQTLQNNKIMHILNAICKKERFTSDKFCSLIELKDKRFTGSLKLFNYFLSSFSISYIYIFSYFLY